MSAADLDNSIFANQITYSRLDMKRLAQEHPEQLAEALTFCMSILKSQIKPADLDRLIKHPRHTVEMDTARDGLDRIRSILSLASTAARDADPATILAACTMLPPDEINVQKETYDEYRNKDNGRTPLVQEIVKAIGISFPNE